MSNPNNKLFGLIVSILLEGSDQPKASLVCKYCFPFVLLFLAEVPFLPLPKRLWVLHLRQLHLSSIYFSAKKAKQTFKSKHIQCFFVYSLTCFHFLPVSFFLNVFFIHSCLVIYLLFSPPGQQLLFYCTKILK